MKYNLAFKYRIYPNKEQELLINKTFGCVRFVYNTILYTANKFYEETGKNTIITPASLKSENQFLKEVDSLALSNAQLNVKRSFTNFFQKLVFTFQTSRCNYFIFPSFFIKFICSVQNRIVNKTDTSKSLIYQ